VELSKKDKLYKDALQTAAESRDQNVAEELLKFFVEIANHSGFAATLYTCYDLIRADVALELAWRNKIIDFVFPFIIQFVRDFQTRVDKLENAGKDKDDIQQKKKDKAPEAFQQPPNPDAPMGLGVDGLPYGVGGFQAPLALMPPPGVYPQAAYIPGVVPGMPPGQIPYQVPYGQVPYGGVQQDQGYGFGFQ